MSIENFSNQLVDGRHIKFSKQILHVPVCTQCCWILDRGPMAPKAKKAAGPVLTKSGEVAAQLLLAESRASNILT